MVVEPRFVATQTSRLYCKVKNNRFNTTQRDKNTIHTNERTPSTDENIDK